MLVVGAAGFLGRAIVRRASNHGVDELTALVRRPAPELAQYAKVHVGDARRVRLGLAPAAAGELSERVRELVVAVGGVRFDATPAQTRSEHLAPLQGLLAFAATCPNLERLVYVSSLAAVGDSTEPLGPGELPVRFRPRNFYEWGKHEAERMLRRCGLPVRVVRPAQIMSSVDDLDRTRSPLVLFELLPMLASGWPIVTGPNTPYWCAPVDFVADVTLAVGRPAGPDSAWAIDPDGPTLDGILDHLAVRHGIAPRRLRSDRLAALAAAVVKPSWFGSAAPREVLAYCGATYRPDLSGVRQLIADGVVVAPPDRGYVARTIEHELERWRSMP